MVARIWVVFVVVFLIYSWVVYSFVDVSNKEGIPDKQVTAGWKIWQEKNCQSCHQLYGLGGYMGPDLTNTASDPVKGAQYIESFIKNGTAKMPRFNLNDSEINHLTSFLSWVDKSGKSRVPAGALNWSGSYRFDN